MKNDPSSVARRSSLRAPSGPGTSPLIDPEGDSDFSRARLRQRFRQIDRSVVAGLRVARSRGGTDPSGQSEARPASESATNEALMERYQRGGPSGST